MPAVAQRLFLTGRVQGVGFRPFVYRLAHELQLDGFVRNLRGDVEIVVAGPESAVARFARDVVTRAPPLAKPVLHEVATVQEPVAHGFAIAASAAIDNPRISVPPDYFCCPECLAELADPADRRHGYPFINCTQCGPRYTLIEALPYDRPNTTMRGFELCDDCRREYEDPLDRRFHAEPVACAKCGPHLTFVAGDGDSDRIPGDSDRNLAQGDRTRGDESALAAAVAALRAGQVLAVKGIGGYHLLCDARSDVAVARLRERKRRPDKPLAVMYPWRGADGLAELRNMFEIGAAEHAALLDPARPIVLLRTLPGTGLASGVAPGLREVGVFLPYSPLHQLLLGTFAGPVVATSGNVSGEPVLTDATTVESRLARVADAFLHHDRPITRPADDSVVRVIAGRGRPIRLGRGIAPLELSLPCRLPEPVLAVGGHLKLTVALAWDQRVVISPHVGDMGTLRSEEVFGQVVADLQQLYDVRATRVLCDAHPDYATTRWARLCGLPWQTVQHHEAHASALVTEHGAHAAPAIVFAWDGVGYGADGTLWGGETFVGRPGGWQRRASLRAFSLPGGDKAGRAPWRSAAAVCWELGLDCPVAIPDAIVRAAWEKKLNAPRSSAAGRLFDAAAAMVLGLGETSFEGQGPMWLEAIAQPVQEFPTLPLVQDPDGLVRIDWAPLVEWLCSPGAQATAGERAGAVHAALADAIVRVAELERASLGIDAAVVGLTGGVFQNRFLAELAAGQLQQRGFRVLLPQAIPCNDGGLSYGQVADFAGRNV
jgi:hydrogenase maturation protein HypF